jgi:VPDSG-CTERM motif
MRFALVRCLLLFFGMKSIALKHKLSLCMATCAALLAFSHNASALSVGDSHELGFIWPGIPGNQNNVTYVNHLIGMALGGFDIANGQIYSRSNNSFGSLPTAVWALNGTGTTINLGAGGVYTYLFASYSGLGAEVWYVGDLHGVITIPAIFNLCGLTKWTLFGPGGAGVPDGGTTAMLLGAALGALGMARRVLRI